MSTLEIPKQSPTKKQGSSRGSFGSFRSNKRASFQDMIRAEHNDYASETEEDSNDGRERIKNSMAARYGIETKDADAYVPGPKLRLIAMILGILLIPTQLLCANTLQSFEIYNIILPLQEWRKGNVKQFGELFIDFATYTFKFNVWCVIMQLLNFFSDSLLTYKVVLTTCFGCFWIVFMKMIFADSRPFWENFEVSTFGICTYEFPSPNIQGFFICFSCVYLYMQHRFLYAQKTKTSVWINRIFMTLIVLLAIENIFAGAWNGISFIYQTTLGSLFGLVYLVACLVFESEIHEYAEKTAFITKSSRQRKFSQCSNFCFFFIAFTTYYLSMTSNEIPIRWVKNAVIGSKECATFLQNSQVTEMGYSSTFNYGIAIFVPITATFAQSYSIQYVSPLAWVRTEWKRKLVRTILACVVQFGLLYLQTYIHQLVEPKLVKFMNFIFIGGIVQPYLSFGLLPILFNKIGLVSKEIKLKTSVVEYVQN